MRKVLYVYSLKPENINTDLLSSDSQKKTQNLGGNFGALSGFLRNIFEIELVHKEAQNNVGSKTLRTFCF